MRRLVPALLLPLALLAAGCGGGKDEEEPPATGVTETTIEAVPGSLAGRLAQRPGENVELVAGSSDFAVGEVRLTFLVVRGNNQLVRVPRAAVYVARRLEDRPMLKTSARPEPVGPPGLEASPAEPTELYVARFPIREPGRYAVLVEPQGETIQAVGQIDVRRTTRSLAVGARAFPSDNPTLDDAPAKLITTSRPPDTELLRSSVRDAMRAGAPFVVTFATPKFCESRTCGPTVDVVDEVRRRFAGRGIRFIHVEIYENNDPQQGVNRWVQEWKLPTEPWVFVVDRSGVIRAKFEGSASVAELEQAVRAYLT